jgi:hypothetical protein
VHSAKATPSQGHLSATERLPLLFLSFRLSLSTPIISPFLVYSRFLSFYFFFSLSFAQSIQSPCIRSTVLLCRKSNTSSDHRYHDSGSLLLSFGFRLYYKITFDHNQSPSITLVIHFWFKIFVVSITPPPLFFFFLHFGLEHAFWFSRVDPSGNSVRNCWPVFIHNLIIFSQSVNDDPVHFSSTVISDLVFDPKSSVSPAPSECYPPLLLSSEFARSYGRDCDTIVVSMGKTLMVSC